MKAVDNADSDPASKASVGMAVETFADMRTFTPDDEFHNLGFLVTELLAMTIDHYESQLEERDTEIDELESKLEDIANIVNK